MAKVTALPEGQTSGDLMTQFIETATKKSQNWTFDAKQNHFYALNEGVCDLEFKVGDTVKQIRPTENFGIETEFTSFSVKALTDDEDITSAYSIAATRYGYPGMDKIKDIETAKPAENQPKEPVDK